MEQFYVNSFIFFYICLFFENANHYISVRYMCSGSFDRVLWQIRPYANCWAYDSSNLLIYSSYILIINVNESTELNTYIINLIYTIHLLYNWQNESPIDWLIQSLSYGTIWAYKSKKNLFEHHLIAIQIQQKKNLTGFGLFFLIKFFWITFDVDFGILWKFTA